MKHLLEDAKLCELISEAGRQIHGYNYTLGLDGSDNPSEHQRKIGVRQLFTEKAIRDLLDYVKSLQTYAFYINGKKILGNYASPIACYHVALETVKQWMDRKGEYMQSMNAEHFNNAKICIKVVAVSSQGDQYIIDVEEETACE